MLLLFAQPGQRLVIRAAGRGHRSAAPAQCVEELVQRDVGCSGSSAQRLGEDLTQLGSCGRGVGEVHPHDPAVVRFERLDDWLHWLEGHHPTDIELGLERIRAVAVRLVVALNASPIPRRRQSG